MIVLQGISKTFGQVQAVSDASFAVAQGTALALIGPSGSGKTTVLRLIAGLERPDTGEIHIDGHLASRPGAVTPPHTRGIGMVFQRPALWPHMTVARNVTFGLARWPRNQAKARLNEVLEWVGVSGLKGRYPHQLSGGEAQRVALARALAPHPRILLLDEPLSNLDPERVSSILDVIHQVRDQTGVTLIYVSHDAAAKALCERAVVMHRGRVVQAGVWQEIAPAANTRSAPTIKETSALEIGR